MVASLPGVARVEAQGAFTRVFLQPGHRPSDLMREMVARGVTLEHFETVRTPVEEIFVRTVQAGERA
jgi:hypothetical protein